MTEYVRPFRYHAIDVDGDRHLGTFPSQQEATHAVLRDGEAVALGPGTVRRYVVRIEAKDSGSSYDVELNVEAPDEDKGSLTGE